MSTVVSTVGHLTMGMDVWGFEAWFDDVRCLEGADTLGAEMVHSMVPIGLQVRNHPPTSDMPLRIRRPRRAMSSGSVVHSTPESRGKFS